MNDSTTQSTPQTPPAAPPQQEWQAPPAAAAPVKPTVDPRVKSPVLAVLLSMMPGLGQVYVGYYKQGFVNILIIGSVISFLATAGHHDHPLTPLAGLFLAFFWLYNIVDAGRRASQYNQALSGHETIKPPSDFKMPGPGGSMVGGICLLLLGIILLSNTLFGFSLHWMEDWWPVALFIPGAWLIWRSIQERAAR